MENLVAFIKKYKAQVLLVGVVISFLFFIGGSLLLQQRNSQQKTEALQSAGQPTLVELKVGKGRKAEETAGDAASAASATFLREPSAEALIQQLRDMQNLQADVAQKRLQALRVLWPVFFFEIRRQGEKSIASFDIAPDGFGVVVEVEYSPARFPEIADINRGDRVWLGGEITAVELSGTGRVQLRLEYIDFSPELPGVVGPTEQSKTEEQPR